MNSESINIDSQSLDYSMLEDLINEYMLHMAMDASLNQDVVENDVISQDVINKECPLTYIENDVECSICLRTILVGSRMRQLKCLHYFCRKCIDPYLVKKPECPNCRMKII